MGIYLVDIYCPGIKDTFVLEFESHDDFIEKIHSPAKEEIIFIEISSDTAFYYIYVAL